MYIGLWENISPKESMWLLVRDKDLASNPEAYVSNYKIRTSNDSKLMFLNLMTFGVNAS